MGKHFFLLVVLLLATCVFADPPQIDNSEPDFQTRMDTLNARAAEKRVAQQDADKRKTGQTLASPKISASQSATRPSATQPEVFHAPVTSAEIKVAEGTLKVFLDSPIIYKWQPIDPITDELWYQGTLDVKTEFIDNNGSEVKATEGFWAANGKPSEVIIKGDEKIFKTNEGFVFPAGTGRGKLFVTFADQTVVLEPISIDLPISEKESARTVIQKLGMPIVKPLTTNAKGESWTWTTLPHLWLIVEDDRVVVIMLSDLEHP